jgi:hypothetical protein
MQQVTPFANEDTRPDSALNQPIARECCHSLELFICGWMDAPNRFHGETMDRDATSRWIPPLLVLKG